MAKTLLNSVNEICKKMGWVNTGSALSSLTDSGKQQFIDHAVQAFNETIDDLYTRAGLPRPNGVSSATLTLVTDDRDYDLGITDMSRIIWPIIDEDNDYYINEYPGGWHHLYQDKPLAADWTGRAEYAVVRPTDGQLLLDLTPTSDENGLTYTVYYEKDNELSLAADTVPFNDIVFRAVIEAATEKVRFNRNSGAEAVVYNAAVAKAARLLTQVMPRDHW